MSNEIQLYGAIGETEGGDGITANTFAEQYAAASTDEPLDVYISSPGGVVRDGLTIYSMLAAHPSPVRVHAYGVVGSIATIIACASDEVVMAQNAKFMIHNPMGPSAMGWGDADDLREAAAETEKMASILDGIKDSMADIYAARSGSDKAQILDWMQAETWFSATEAKRAGFADSIVPNKTIAACSTAEPFAVAVDTIEELEELAQMAAAINPKQQPEHCPEERLALARAKMDLTLRIG